MFNQFSVKVTFIILLTYKFDLPYTDVRKLRYKNTTVYVNILIVCVLVKTAHTHTCVNTLSMKGYVSLEVLSVFNLISLFRG